MHARGRAASAAFGAVTGGSDGLSSAFFARVTSPCQLRPDLQWRIDPGSDPVRATTSTCSRIPGISGLSMTSSDPTDSIPFLHAVPQPRTMPTPKRAIRLPSSVGACQRRQSTSGQRRCGRNSDGSSPVACRPDERDSSAHSCRRTVAPGQHTRLHRGHRARARHSDEGSRRSSRCIVCGHPAESRSSGATRLPLTAGESLWCRLRRLPGPEQPDLERFTPIAGAMRGTLVRRLGASDRPHGDRLGACFGRHLA